LVLNLHHWFLPEMNSDAGNEESRELYANYFRVGFNSAEFLLDFGRHFEGGPDYFIQRIITAPLHAKELLALLAQSLCSYEERFGKIRESEQEGELNK
jgi:hypothetical protein